MFCLEAAVAVPVCKNVVNVAVTDAGHSGFWRTLSLASRFIVGEHSSQGLQHFV